MRPCGGAESSTVLAVSRSMGDTGYMPAPPCDIDHDRPPGRPEDDDPDVERQEALEALDRLARTLHVTLERLDELLEDHDVDDDQR